MKHLLIIISVIALLTITGCTKVTIPDDVQDKPVPDADIDSCEIDSDCICGGIDTNTDRCFMGSVDYYEKYVDKSRDCPDFCTGIAGNLVMRCIDNKCIQIYGCLMDKDCRSDQMCINNKCTGVEDLPVQVTDPETEQEIDAGCGSDSDCRTGGCSGQLCEPKSKEPRMTTCEFLPEYVCYDDIDCGCIDGKCAWKEDDSFRSCIQQARS